MEINTVIYNYLIENKNIISNKEVNELGFSRALLSVYEKKGLLERVRQGVYVLPNSIHDDMFTLMQRSNNIVFSHETALFLLGLSERTPFIHTVTIPTGTSLPHSIEDECKCFYINPELHNLGVIKATTTFGNEVRCYDVERTICDIVRSRNKLDEETVIGALKNYSKYDNRDLNKLYSYAVKFKIANRIRTYLEVLL